MNTILKNTIACSCLAFLATTNLALAQDGEKDLKVGTITQTVETQGKAELKSKGFGNFQGLNLIRSEGSILSGGGGEGISQTVTLNNEILDLDQKSVASRQAANYVGARDSIEISSITQSVTEVGEVKLNQEAAISVQGVNVIESGAGILPAEELGDVADAITKGVIDAVGGKIKGAISKVTGR